MYIVHKNKNNLKKQYHYSNNFSWFIIQGFPSEDFLSLPNLTSYDLLIVRGREGGWGWWQIKGFYFYVHYFIFYFYLAKGLENILCFYFFEYTSFLFFHMVKGGETNLIWGNSNLWSYFFLYFYSGPITILYLISLPLSLFFYVTRRSLGRILWVDVGQGDG